MKSPLFFMVTITPTTPTAQVIMKISVDVDFANTVSGQYQKFSVIGGNETALTSLANLPMTEQAAFDIIAALKPVLEQHFGTI